MEELVENAQAILISAGAGMGVDSGLPDFRGEGGFWREYPVIKKLGLHFEDMANPKSFSKDPFLAWAFYAHRLALYKKTQPHEGFFLLKKLAKLKNNNYFIFTSNVDGQFQKAGFKQERICEVHGSIFHMQCFHDCKDEIWQNMEEIPFNEQSFKALKLPVCKHCARLARPNILMFNDFYFNAKRQNAQLDAYFSWLDENRLKKILIIEIGAGQAVPTVRHQSEQICAKLAASLIRINPRESELGKAKGFSLAMAGLEGIKRLMPK